MSFALLSGGCASSLPESGAPAPEAVSRPEARPVAAPVEPAPVASDPIEEFVRWYGVTRDLRNKLIESGCLAPPATTFNETLVGYNQLYPCAERNLLPPYGYRDVLMFTGAHMHSEINHYTPRQRILALRAIYSGESTLVSGNI
jgi:hypothetical protein